MSLFMRSFHLAHYVFPSGGTCWEFGVGQGDTYLWQISQIVQRYQGSSLVGFDSWAGLPEETEGVWAPARHSPGEFAVKKVEVEKRIPKDSRFSFVDGWFSETLSNGESNAVDNLVFVNIDVDLHTSALSVLQFIRPSLRPGVVIYWDDWKDPHDVSPEPWGEHRAWNEWYPEQKNLEVETVEVNAANQRSMIVVGVGEQHLTNARLCEIRRKCLGMSWCEVKND